MYPSTSTWQESPFFTPFKIIAVYLGWKIFRYSASLNGLPLNHLWTKFILITGHFYAVATVFCLTGLGVRAAVQDITVKLLSSGKELWVQEHCLAIPAMVIFAGTVVVLKGNTIDKAWFILSGFTGIILINIIRLAFVALAWNYLTPYYFHMHHSIIYAVITYGFIFFLIRWWILRSQ